MTCGGAGMSPVAPGTVASLATSALLMVIYLSLWRVGAVSRVAWEGLLAGGVILASLLSVVFGPWAAKAYGRKDPPSFVLDEVAGICLTMAFLPMYPGWHEAWAVLAGFLAFRLFDVWKPWPCPKLETLPDGWGILMDDLGAAVYANVLCQIVLRLVFGGAG